MALISVPVLFWLQLRLMIMTSTDFNDFAVPRSTANRARDFLAIARERAAPVSGASLLALVRREQVIFDYEQLAAPPTANEPEFALGCRCWDGKRDENWVNCRGIRVKTWKTLNETKENCAYIRNEFNLLTRLCYNYWAGSSRIISTLSEDFTSYSSEASPRVFIERKPFCLASSMRSSSDSWLCGTGNWWKLEVVRNVQKGPA